MECQRRGLFLWDSSPAKLSRLDGAPFKYPLSAWPALVLGGFQFCPSVARRFGFGEAKPKPEEVFLKGRTHSFPALTFTWSLFAPASYSSQYSQFGRTALKRVALSMRPDFRTDLHAAGLLSLQWGALVYISKFKFWIKSTKKDLLK